MAKKPIPPPHIDGRDPLKTLPNEEYIYTMAEVKAMCGFTSDEQLREAVADGRFPAAIQHSRQAPPLWLGRPLRAWLELQPTLHREKVVGGGD